MKYSRMGYTASLFASLPSRERGLKCTIPQAYIWLGSVAPFAGARIEIIYFVMVFRRLLVAPFAGARIEIKVTS